MLDKEDGGGRRIRRSSVDFPVTGHNSEEDDDDEKEEKFQVLGFGLLKLTPLTSAYLQCC